MIRPFHSTWTQFYSLALLLSLSLTLWKAENIVVADSTASSRRKRTTMSLPRQFPTDGNRMSIANMTCAFYRQPLNHFGPKGESPMYLQRYCTYSGFLDVTAPTKNYPIFLYTGNESPLEVYINNTGLMWELAPKYHAQIIFMEHRYEGESVPFNVSEKCMSYCSSVQALADYVALLDHINPNSVRPVIAFGGSYGGMLSAWLRMKYPNMIAGAIAGSAPIWGLPRTRPHAIDTAYQVVTHGIDMPYPPTNKEATEENYCSSNLLAAWPLITFLGTTLAGRQELTRAFRLCNSLETVDDVTMLLEWAQTPWFLLAEGSFPYPSSYIPFAIHMGDHNLPPWPLQAACWRESTLHRDWGVEFDIPSGNDMSNVTYMITYGGSNLVLDVDWDKVKSKNELDSLVLSSESVQGLLTSVRDAISVWFNVTKDVQCFNVTPAVDADSVQYRWNDHYNLGKVDHRRASGLKDLRGSLSDIQDVENATRVCDDKIASEGSWNSLCCNEDINMVIQDARGLGRDMFWPPSHPRGTKTYADIVAQESEDDGSCDDPSGLFGYPIDHDPWSVWLDLYYGGLRVGAHSNIIFSNGLLDPWSAGGVYAPGVDPTPPGSAHTRDGWRQDSGPMIQNITRDGSVIALIIEFGGHHVDLMYSSPDDPKCVTDARSIENDFIHMWINQWCGGKQGMVCKQDEVGSAV